MTDRPAPTAVRRPWTLWAALVMVALEVAVLVVSAGFFVVLSRSGDTEVGSSLLSLAVMFGVLALGLVAVIMGLYRMHRWARPATVAWQVLLGRPARLGVEHAVGHLVEHPFARDPRERRSRLHDGERLVEGLEVAGQVARISGLGEPRTQRLRVRRGRLMARLRRQLDDRRGSQTAVQVVME